MRQLPLERTGSEPKTTEISTLAVSQHRAQLLPCHNWCSGGLLARTNRLGTWDWTLASSRSGELVVGVTVNTQQPPVIQPLRQTVKRNSSSTGNATLGGGRLLVHRMGNRLFG